MRVLRDKKGMIVHLIMAMSAVMALSISVRAEEKVKTPASPPPIQLKPVNALPAGGKIPPSTGATSDAVSNTVKMPPAAAKPNAGANKGAAQPGQRGVAPVGGRPMLSRPSIDKNRGKKAQSGPDPEVYRVVPQKCVPAKANFVWNFEEEELVTVLRQVSDLLCKTFVINEAISKNQKFTIIGKSPMSPADAWNILNAAMAAKGLALAQQGNTYTVIKRNESKNFSTPFYSQGLQAKNNEEIGTLFYKVEHATPEALKNIARLLISKDGIVETIGDSFILIIDGNNNIRRLGTIIAQVDIQDALDKIHFIPLQHADAKSVERQLRDLFEVSSGPAGMPRRPRRPGETSQSSLNIRKIIADERQNGLIIETDPNSLDKLKEVISLIDQPASDQATKGKIHVYRLRYADAKKIAETLNAVIQQGSNRGRSRFGRRPDETTNELFEGEVKVTAHENTNTLVTVASANDWRAVLSTIKELDERKEQVYVEAVIMDIRINDSSEFGINAFGGVDMKIPGLNGSTLGILGNAGGRDIIKGVTGSLGSANTLDFAGDKSLGALAVLTNFLSGGVAGFVGPTIPGTKIPSFGAVLQALSTSSHVDILSTPYLLTSDNQEAEMKVGEKVPMLRGASSVGSSGLAGGTIPMQNIAYENVDLTLKITPRVGADNIISLTVAQEVNELGNAEPILGTNQYHINTKSAKTTIVLKDQQTGVIGGLISHKTNRTDNKVPFLGDIPLLGWLFKNRQTKNDRKSLVLILTPYIIRDERDYEEILKKKLREREEFAELYFGGKIKHYNKSINYDKKAGPLASMFRSLDSEMNKVENGGPGDGSETIIVPKEKVKRPEKLVPPAPAIILEESILPPDDLVPSSSLQAPEQKPVSLEETPVNSDVTMFGPDNGGAEEPLLLPKSE